MGPPISIPGWPDFELRELHGGEKFFGRVEWGNLESVLRYVLSDLENMKKEGWLNSEGWVLSKGPYNNNEWVQENLVEPFEEGDVGYALMWAGPKENEWGEICP